MSMIAVFDITAGTVADKGGKTVTLPMEAITAIRDRVGRQESLADVLVDFLNRGASGYAPQGAPQTEVDNRSVDEQLGSTAQPTWKADLSVPPLEAES